MPIRGGGRLTGKVGGLNVGALNMQTGDVDARPGQQLLGVPRQQGAAESVQHRRHVREPDGHGRPGRERRLEPDVGRRRPARRRRVLHRRGLCGADRDPGRNGRDYAYNVDSRYANGTHEVGFEYGQTGEDFNPEVGFLENEFGYRRMQFRVQETMRQDWIREWHFREWLPHASYTRYDYLDGGLNTAEMHVDNHWDWENGYRVDTALQGQWEGFREPFEIYPGVVVPAGETGGLFFRMNSNTDRRKALSAALRWDVGTFLTGNQNSPRLQVTIRDGGRFAVDTTWNYSSVVLPQGSFRTNLGNMRVTYNFSTTMFVQSLVQYNDRTRRWSDESAVPLAGNRRHRALRRLQRYREHRRLRTREPRVHRQVRAAVRYFALELTGSRLRLAGSGLYGATRLGMPVSMPSGDRLFSWQMYSNSSLPLVQPSV